MHPALPTIESKLLILALALLPSLGCSIAPPGGDQEGALEGRLFLEGGTPAADALIRAGAHATSAAGDGSFRLAPLDDGDYEVILEAAGHGLTRLPSTTVSQQRATNLGEIELLAEQDLPGNLDQGDVDLDAARTYILRGNARVGAGSVLRLGEGTRVVFEGNAELRVDGVLQAATSRVPTEFAATGSGVPTLFLSANSGPHALSNARFNGLYEGINVAAGLDLQISSCRFANMGRVALYVAGSSVTIRDCTIAGSTYGLELFDTPTVLVEDSHFENCVLSAIVASNTGLEVRNNWFIANGTAIELSTNVNPLIVHNSFLNNGVGIAGSSCSPRPNGMLIELNDFAGGDEADVLLTLNCYPVVTRNNFSPEADVALRSPNNTLPDTLLAMLNYWGTADAAHIPGRIQDVNDNSERAPVAYLPYELAPLAGVGAE